MTAFTVEKPEGYTFIPGQATEVTVNKPDWKEEKRPFTFTSLNEWPHLEFTIKIYRDHDGVTNQLGQLQAGDELVIHDVWGAIQYKGPGTFIAGGAGITPFIAIFRDLHHRGELKDSLLYFSNKTREDIILKDELQATLGNGFYNIITRDEQADDGYEYGRMNAAYIKGHIRDFDRSFYICGPEGFVSDISDILSENGVKADALVVEE